MTTNLNWALKRLTVNARPVRCGYNVQAASTVLELRTERIRLARAGSCRLPIPGSFGVDRRHGPRLPQSRQPSPGEVQMPSSGLQQFIPASQVVGPQVVGGGVAQEPTWSSATSAR